jgi:hypothetical protein
MRSPSEDLITLLDRNQSTVQRHAAQKSLRAVYGIEDPSSARTRAGDAELFPHDSIARESAADPLARCPLGLDIGSADRRAVSLRLRSTTHFGVFEVPRRHPTGKLRYFHYGF